MKKTNSTFIKSMISYTTIALLGASIMSCAHEKPTKPVPKVDPVAISSSSTPAEEIRMQQSLIDQAYASQTDVLAPVHFDESVRYFNQAKKENQKGASAETVFKSLSMARGHLQKANDEAKLTEANVGEVTHARNQAIVAGARKYPAKLNALDDKFKRGLKTTEKKTALQNQYLDLELSTIKQEKLGKAQSLLNQAKVKGAQKTTPNAYNDALSKLNIAEKTIETDRHSNTKIDKAVAVATAASTRVMNLLASEQSSRNRTPEERAVTLETKDKALTDADNVISEVAAGSMKKDEELALQGGALALSQDKNKVLERNERDDKIVANAAAQFDASEADVYRQDGLLIIRLKSMNFASGRSDLPAESMPVLTKVKEVIKDLGPGEIVVQGHTDGVGAASTNQKLSQNRAKAVEQFFSTDKALENNKFDSIGYGYSKPLGSNKTKEGRAQNRRVDIVIKTTQSI